MKNKSYMFDQGNQRPGTYSPRVAQQCIALERASEAWAWITPEDRAVIGQLTINEFCAAWADGDNPIATIITEGVYDRFTLGSFSTFLNRGQAEAIDDQRIALERASQAWGWMSVVMRSHITAMTIEAFCAEWEDGGDLVNDAIADAVYDRYQLRRLFDYCNRRESIAR